MAKKLGANTHSAVRQPKRARALNIAAPTSCSPRPIVGQFELSDRRSKAAARAQGAANSPQRAKLTLDRMLRASGWASALTSAELDRVCQETHERFAVAGAPFVRAGTSADFWVGVVEGMVKMSVSLPNGRESTFTAVSAGSWFGEGTLMKSERWRYDAIAVRDSRVACMPRATFQRLLHSNLRFSHSVMALMNARLSQFIGLAVFDRLLSTDMRVARCLASLFDPDLYPSASSFVKLTQDEIGLLSAVSRQRANRALHTLQDAGLLRIEFGGVTVLNVPGLWGFSGDSDAQNIPQRRRPPVAPSTGNAQAKNTSAIASSKRPP